MLIALMFSVKYRIETLYCIVLHSLLLLANKDAYYVNLVMAERIECFWLVQRITSWC